MQMQMIADGSLRWSIVHWTAAAALSFFAIAGLVALAAGSRLTQDWWTLSAWAVLPVGALWTVSPLLPKPLSSSMRQFRETGPCSRLGGRSPRAWRTASPPWRSPSR
jgi:hypothetical protein